MFTARYRDIGFQRVSISFDSSPREICLRYSIVFALQRCDPRYTSRSTIFETFRLRRHTPVIDDCSSRLMEQRGIIDGIDETAASSLISDAIKRVATMSPGFRGISQNILKRRMYPKGLVGFPDFRSFEKVNANTEYAN